MDPDIAPGSVSAWSTSWLQVEAPASQIRMALAPAWNLDTNKTTSYSLDSGYMWPLVAIWVMDFNTDLGCGMIVDPDTVLGSNPGLVVTMTLGGSKG